MLNFGEYLKFHHLAYLPNGITQKAPPPSFRRLVRWGSLHTYSLDPGPAVENNISQMIHPWDWNIFHYTGSLHPWDLVPWKTLYWYIFHLKHPWDLVDFFREKSRENIPYMGCYAYPVVDVLLIGGEIPPTKSALATP